MSDRFDHVRFTAACAIALSVALIGAIFVPSLPLSIALFALVGVASGPIFPMIVAIGGERYADRSAAVGGVLTGFGVVGGTIYPPLMGVLSVTVGLTVAMVGSAVLGLACAGALIAFESTHPGLTRRPVLGRARRPPPARTPCRRRGPAAPPSAVGKPTNRGGSGNARRIAR